MQDTSFYQKYVEMLKLFMADNFGMGVSEVIVIIIEVVFWFAILIIADTIIKNMVLVAIRRVINVTNLTWDDILYKNKVFNSALHLIPLILAHNIKPLLFSGHIGLQLFFSKLISLFTTIVITHLIFRIINSILEINSKSTNSYTTVGIRTFGQLSKVVIIFLSTIIGVAILFDVEVRSIFTALATVTAIVILIFRDYILGFVSGIQISSSKNVKVGDFVSISKGNIEGTIKEININLVKVENIDKTISTVPTADLVTSLVTNHMPMIESGTKMIKRSISFNVNSFKFCDKEMLENYKKIELIKNYVAEKQKEIDASNRDIPNLELTINGRQQTNIGVFRRYVELYLTNNPRVSKKGKDNIVVRQLATTPAGMPLEVMCFANSSDGKEFEEIQSNIFDHLLSASKYFNLEIMQNVTLSDLKKTTND